MGMKSSARGLTPDSGILAAERGVGMARWVVSVSSGSGSGCISEADSLQKIRGYRQSRYRAISLACSSQLPTCFPSSLLFSFSLSLSVSLSITTSLSTSFPSPPLPLHQPCLSLSLQLCLWRIAGRPFSPLISSSVPSCNEYCRASWPTRLKGYSSHIMPTSTLHHYIAER